MSAIAPGDLALLVTVTLVWGLNLIVSKMGLGKMPPLLFTTLRMAIVAVLLAPRPGVLIITLRERRIVDIGT